MKLASVNLDGQEAACICTDSGHISLNQVNQHSGSCWPTDLWTLLQSDELNVLKHWYSSDGLQ